MDRHAKKNLCQDKTTDQTSHSPRYPNASTNATAGTNRRNAKDKRTIPLDHPRTGPNNSSYVMDGSTRHFWPLSVTEQFLSGEKSHDL